MYDENKDEWLQHLGSVSRKLKRALTSGQVLRMDVNPGVSVFAMARELDTMPSLIYDDFFTSESIAGYSSTFLYAAIRYSEEYEQEELR